MPMMTISISREGESAEPQQGMDPTVARKPSELSAGKVAMISASAHQSISLIRQGLSNAVNNYGNVTGDYTRQKNMQKALGVANDMATLGIAAATSLATGNWLATVFAVASMATGKAIEGINFAESQKNARLQASYGLSRLGVLSDGSRN